MKKQILSEEFIRMQRLAGIINETQYSAQLTENKIGSIDLELVKKLQNSPEAKQIAQKLQSDKNLLNKALKLVANNSSNPMNENEEDKVLRLQKTIIYKYPEKISKDGYLNGKELTSYSSDELEKLINSYKEGEENKRKDAEDKNKLTTKDKVKSILTNAGLGALAGGTMATFIAGATAIAPAVMIPSLLVAALIGTGIGAAATDGYKRKNVTVDETESEDKELNVKDQVLRIIDLGKKV